VREQSTIWPGSPRRALALLLALACLWIAGVGSLAHTDDIAPLLRFHAGRSAVAHAVPAPPAAPCAACQWEGIACHAPPASVQVVRLPLAQTPASTPLPGSCAFPPLRHAAPRAPPPA
jgi:hypothetical protein